MKRALGFIVMLLFVGGLASDAGAEIAVLTNGSTLKLTAHRQEGNLLYLSLKDGGELGLLATDVQGIVPDEFVEEVVPEVIAAVNRGGDLRALATEAARRHGVAPELVLAMVKAESAFRPDAVSPKGAQGLMQLMPATARELGVADSFDPLQNLDGGTRYLKQLLARYNGDVKKAVAAYNAGPGAVQRHKGVPPYRETLHYVERVLREYQAAAAKEQRTKK
jgi:soluble lytic murein transglycosylase-like protein